MGFRVNRRISLGKNVRVNIGKRGVSTSVKMGPVTVNSRGRKTVHVAKGVSYTINPKTKRNTAPQRRSTVESNQQASYALICRQHATSASPKDFEAARNPVQGV